MLQNYKKKNDLVDSTKYRQKVLRDFISFMMRQRECANNNNEMISQFYILFFTDNNNQSMFFSVCWF